MIPSKPTITVFSKFFSTLQTLRSSQVKQRLALLEREHIVIKKSPKDIARILDKKRLQHKKLQKKAYPKSKAIHYVNKKFQIDENNIKIGPTTNEDLPYLQRTKEKRLIYSILGTTGEQLRDSRLICNDARKFLSRGQIEKAIYLTKLAKNKGSAAMNLVMEYYLKELSSPKSAINLYNWRKKNGVPLNEYSNTILFDGIAKQPKPVSTDIGEKVFTITERLMEENNLNGIEFNSALGSLSNCENPKYALQLFYSIKNNKELKEMQYNAITLVYLLRSCNNISSEQTFIETFNSILKSIPRKCCDSRMMFEVSKCLASRVENKELTLSALAALHNYFQIHSEMSPPPTSSALFLPKIKHWGMERKFPISVPVAGLYMNTCLNLKDIKRGQAFFIHLKDLDPDLIDISIFHNLLELIIQEHPTTCVEECLSAYHDMELLGKDFKSKHTIKLLFMAFKKQSNKEFVTKDIEKTDQLLQQLNKFVEDTDSIVSIRLNEKVFTQKSWKFIFSIIRTINLNQKIKLETSKEILINFLKSFISGEFALTNHTVKEVQCQRFIELGGIRLINYILDIIKIPRFKESNIESITSVEKEQYLDRRYLLRIKSGLLERVKRLELMIKDKKYEVHDESDPSLSNLCLYYIQRNKALKIR